MSIVTGLFIGFILGIIITVVVDYYFNCKSVMKAAFLWGIPILLVFIGILIGYWLL